MSLLPALLLLLVGCSPRGPEGSSGDADGEDTSAQGGAGALPTFWIEVEPSGAASGGAVVLPQRFGPYLDGSGFVLELHPAVRLDGTVRATKLSGWALAPIPTVDTPVAATLVFRDDATGSTFPARSDEDGHFEALVVPSAYSLLVAPDDTRATASDEAVRAFEDATLDVRLGVGAALWGRVLDATGTPVPGAVVSAQRSDGFATATVGTDEGGWYELRVEPGTWRLVTAERPGDRRPTLLGAWREVGEDGLRTDVAWAPAERSQLQLRVVEDGEAARDVVVRLTSTELTGYEPDEATYALETRTDSQGFVEARLPDGVYALEVVPGTDVDLAPTRQDDVVLEADLDLGDLAPPGFASTTVRVLDVAGEPLPGADVLCAEVLGLRRSWLAEVDGAGRATLSLPRTALRCLITPPTGRDDLATARLDVDAPDALDEVRLGAGQLVGGRVVVTSDAGEEGAGRAVVRLVDEDGAPIGTTLADEDGAFTIRVDVR